MFIVCDSDSLVPWVQHTEEWQQLIPVETKDMRNSSTHSKVGRDEVQRIGG